MNNGSLGSYGYDGNGKRVKKSESGVTTYYVYSTFMGDAVMEVNASGVQRAYVSSARGKMVALLAPDGNFYWLYQDHLGSSRKMADSSGNMVYRAEFDPYGKLLYEWSSSNQPHLNTKKFTGYERDVATGLDYAQARYYSADWGRFMTPDPMGLGAAGKRSPKTLNRYSYVGGNPTNFLDPKGTCFYYWREVYEGYWKWEDMFCYEEPLILQPDLPPATPEPVEPVIDEPVYSDAAKDLNDFFKTHANCKRLYEQKANDALSRTKVIDSTKSGQLGNTKLRDLGFTRADNVDPDINLVTHLDPIKTKDSAGGYNIAITNTYSRKIYLGGNYFKDQKLQDDGYTRQQIMFHELLHIMASRPGTGITGSHKDVADYIDYKGLGGKGEGQYSRIIDDYLRMNCRFSILTPN